MPDLEYQLQQAVEPLVLELEALRREVATLKAEAPDLEPLVMELDAMREVLEASRAEVASLKGRIDAPAWAVGVYRQGVVVQHFHGQYFEAVADTAAEPGDGVTWRRLGLHGFRYRGLHIDGAEYEAGDLVARDGSMQLQTAGGGLVWLAVRGRRGRPGETGAPGEAGKQGEAGKRGADGANLVKLEAEAGVLFAVWSDGKRAPMALEAVP